MLSYYSFIFALSVSALDVVFLLYSTVVINIQINDQVLFPSSNKRFNQWNTELRRLRSIRASFHSPCDRTHTSAAAILVFETTMTALNDQDCGFPAGYFVLTCVGCDRLADVEQGSHEDGAEIILFPEKEKSLVQGFRNEEADNQVFFVDPTGALCSRSSGHAIDVKGDRLVLRHRRPATYPYPNKFSHPLPKFRYSQSTGEITVHFEHDPTYPAPGEPTSDAWKSKTYVLTSVPLRKPRTVLEDASHFFSTNIFRPIGAAFVGDNPKGKSTPEDVVGLELGADEVVEEERGEGDEVDDSVETVRRLRVVAVVEKEKEALDRELSESGRRRRQWVVRGLRRANARTGGI